MPLPLVPPATFDLSADISLEEGKRYASAVTRVERMDLTSVGTAASRSSNRLMTLPATIPGVARPAVLMLADGGSQASLLDDAAFPAESLQRASIKVDRVRLCLKGITGQGPTTLVHRAHNVTVNVAGSEDKTMRTAYLVDLSHLRVQALFGRPDLRCAHAVEDYHDGVISFPRDSWPSSAPVLEDEEDVLSGLAPGCGEVH